MTRQLTPREYNAQAQRSDDEWSEGIRHHYGPAGEPVRSDAYRAVMASLANGTASASARWAFEGFA